MRIVLVGEESAGVGVLEWLMTTEHSLVAVLAGGTARKASSLAGAAGRIGIRVRPATFVREPGFANWLESESVDLLLNVYSLFLIRPEALLVPTIGCFNLHPGPLPKYAGLNAPSWAVYHGEARHGVTVHWMTPDVDAGPIADQALFDITPDDTGLSVSMKCIRAGLPLVSKLVGAAASNPSAIPRTEQDLRERTYFAAGPPDGGFVSWSASARRIVDFVRAADYRPFPSPWGHPSTSIGGEPLQITEASLTGLPTDDAPPGIVGRRWGDGMVVAAADEWVLLERLRVAGAGAAAVDVLQPGMTLGT
jgi:methionyl-tRNA formyltransferase